MSFELIKKYGKNIIKRALYEQGYFIVPNAYEKNYCISVINFIENHNNSNVETNYAGTEMRIWDSQNNDILLNKFYEDCNNILSYIFNRNFISTTLLAIRNKPLHAQDTYSYLNRWHIDSFQRQLKIFLFLTDTNEKSGPFEFIPGTHKSLFKLRMLMSGHYFRFSNFLSKEKRKYQHLDEILIHKVTAEKGIKPMLCSSGTMVIVDTSLIHRARPCLEENRYALTAYF